jgi:thioredoxin 1
LARTFDTPITTNDQSIDRVLAAGLPVLFVFMDGREPPALEQAMEKLAREYAGDLLVARIPVRDNPETVRRYQITRPPAVVTARNGQVLSKAEAASGDDLVKHTLFLLGKGPKPETAPPDGRPAYTAARAPAAGPTQAGVEGPRIVTDATFDREVLRSTQPVLVDFWAPWCGPCRIVEPTVEKLAREMSGRLNVAKVNVDENPGIAERYGIRSIPTMMIVKEGEIVDRWMGALPEPAIRSRVAPHVH